MASLERRCQSLERTIGRELIELAKIRGALSAYRTAFFELVPADIAAQPTPRSMPDDPPESVARFVTDFLAARIPGLQPRSALSNDVYRAYVAWCKRSDAMVWKIGEFIPWLLQTRNVQKIRKRYPVKGRKSEGPRTILHFDTGASNLRRDRLGESIALFQAAVATYEGGSG